MSANEGRRHLMPNGGITSLPTLAEREGKAALDTIASLRAENAALLARVRAGMEDTQRLDLLDRLRVDVEVHDPGRGDPKHVGYKWKLTGHLHQRDVRTAIDAAAPPSPESGG